MQAVEDEVVGAVQGQPGRDGARCAAQLLVGYASNRTGCAHSDREAPGEHVHLAGGAELTVAGLLAGAHARLGGLVVLSACSTDLTATAYDEALTLATAVLAAGAKSVVGSRWPIDDGDTTICLMLMFHYYRAVEGLSDRNALRAAQRWMLDPDREVVPAVAPVYPSAASDLADPASWAAFTHHGSGDRGPPERLRRGA